MTKLSASLHEASSYWRSQSPGCADAMILRAKACVDILGSQRQAESLTLADARKILAGLAQRGLSRKSVVDYYGAFRRMLALNGVTPAKYAQWPKSPKPPRKERTPISATNLDRMIAGLRENNFGETADLSILLDAFGGRVGIEALRPGGCRYRTQDDGLLVVLVTGKGDHERLVPVTCKKAKAIITDRKRFSRVLAIPYKTHLWRWNKIAEGVGIKGLATFHHIRHKYATDRLKASGGNLRLVQELLGHSNPATTAIYAHVSMDDKVRALTTE